MISGIVFPYKSYNVLNYLKFQHGITDSDKAFLLADETHRILSQLLGQNKYFSSHFQRLERPRSVDFIVFAYLYEEICNLSGFTHVDDSLNNYPNLVEFLKNIQNDIKELKDFGDADRVLDENWLKIRAFQSGGKLKPLETQEYQDGRRKFISFCALGCLAFLFISNR